MRTDGYRGAESITKRESTNTLGSSERHICGDEKDDEFSSLERSQVMKPSPYDRQPQVIFTWERC